MILLFDTIVCLIASPQTGFVGDTWIEGGNIVEEEKY